MSWGRTLRGAWLVLRANQLWAPVDNDADGARRCMRRFYDLVAATTGEVLDTTEAARLEVEWWRVHRESQYHDGPGHDAHQAALAEAVARLYAHVYGADLEAVRPAAELRAAAMEQSDRWVAAGCPPASPMVDEEKALLVRSYAALLAVVHRPAARPADSEERPNPIDLQP